jgi:catabolite regulation protein CreA
MAASNSLRKKSAEKEGQDDYKRRDYIVFLSTVVIRVRDVKRTVFRLRGGCALVAS